MSLKLKMPAVRLCKAFYNVKRNPLIITAMVIVLATSLACSGGEKFSLGERNDDSHHSVEVTSATLVEKVGNITLEEEEIDEDEDIYYLLIGFEIENTSNEQDDLRDWSQYMSAETDKGTLLDIVTHVALEGQLGNTTLLPGRKEEGTALFKTTKKAERDFELTFEFPVSGSQVTYQFRAEDERLSIYVDHILERMEQRERVKNIPLIGGTVERINRASIQYYGEIVVPKGDISTLLEQIDDLTDEKRIELIADYVCERKGWNKAEMQ